MSQIVVQPFFDKETWTFSYVLYNQSDSHCIIVDPVYHYDPKAGRLTHLGADEIIAFIDSHQLKISYILETHAHADHVSASHYLQTQLGGKTVIGERITEVQKVFKSIFNLGDEFKTDGSDFDLLLKDGDVLQFGNTSLEALSVPGHTPACMAYRVADKVFVGDTLFMPDVGTARCDFPGGDAKTLYQSVQKILALPDSTTLYLCHDYPPHDRHQVSHQATVKQQKENNIHIHQGISEEEFIALRTQRDKTLSLPNLIIPSIQLNIRAGKLPAPEYNQISYLKTPLNIL